MAQKSSVIRVSIIGDADSMKAAFGEGVDAAKDFEKDSGKAFDGFSKTAAAVGTAAGQLLAQGFSAAAGLVMDQFSAALGAEASSDKLAAQLGLSPEDAATMATVAGDVYANAWGESLDQVNESLGFITRNIGEGNKEWTQRMSETTLAFSDTFGQDMERVTGAVGTMLNTGVAKSADEAFDILTRGMQTGANKADDLLDTFIEYPTQFRELGLTGQEAMGLLSQGLQAGARDSDTVADALKEFAIRTQDFSEDTRNWFTGLGFDANQLSTEFSVGGDTAKAAFGKVLTALKAIDDPVTRNAGAVALFGTKAEDLGDALFALDPSTAVQQLGEVTGAAAEMGATVGDNAASRIESFKRGALMALQGFIAEKVIPALEGFATTWKDKLQPALETGAAWVQANLIPPLQNFGGIIRDDVLPPLVGFGEWVVNNKEVMIGLGVGIAAIVVPAFIAWAVSAGAAAVATVIAAAPVIALGLAIAGLTAGIIWLWQNFDGFRGSVLWVKDAIVGLWNWVTQNWQTILLVLTGPFGGAIALIRTHWDTLKGWVEGFPGFVSDALTGLANTLTWPFRSAFNSIARAWNNTVGSLSFSVPGWVPGIGGKGWDVPDIPTISAFALGGIVKGGRGGVLGLIGEASHDEAIVPLPKGGGPLGGGPVYNIRIVAPPTANLRDVGREVRRVLAEYDRASGIRVGVL